VKLLDLKARQQSRQITDYYPRKNIGLSLPASTFDYEFLVTGKNFPYNQNQVIRSFIDHGAMLLTLDGSINAAQNKFVLNITCNLEKADLGPRELVVQLQNMKFVISAEYDEIKGRLFVRRISGITFNNNQEAVALPSGTLIALGNRLARESGSTGTAALFQQGREYVRKIVRELGSIQNDGQELAITYYYGNQGDLSEPERIEGYCMKCRKMTQMMNPRQIIFSNKTQAVQGSCSACSTKVFKIGAQFYGKIRDSFLLENVQAYLMAAGWGTFELRTAIEGRYGEVLICDPPTLDGELSAGNQFLEGIAGSLLEVASNNRNKMLLVGKNYDPTRRTLILHFAEHIPLRIKAKQPATSPLSTKKQRRAKLKDKSVDKKTITPIGATEEIDRIIHALESIESGTSGGTNGPVDQKLPEAGVIVEQISSENKTAS